MKGSVSRGTGFRGLSEYLLQEKTGEPRHGARIVGGNMAGTTPRELSAEFRMSRELRPEVARPVWHCSLTLPAGETLSAHQWEDVARGLMQKIGMDPDLHQHVLVRHQDTDHDHVHIQATRIGLDSSLWHGKWEARSVIEATQELEREHGLTLTPGLGLGRAEKKALSKAELNMAARTGQEPPRQRLQRLLDEAMADKPPASELAERLTVAGVGVRAHIASTGKMNGFSFEVAGVSFKGSDLGSKYKWAGLQKAGVRYEQDRDREILERLRAAATNTPEPARATEPGAELEPGIAGATEETGERSVQNAGAERGIKPGHEGPAPGSGLGAGPDFGGDQEVISRNRSEHGSSKANHSGYFSASRRRIDEAVKKDRGAERGNINAVGGVVVSTVEAGRTTGRSKESICSDAEHTGSDCKSDGRVEATRNAEKAVATCSNFGNSCGNIGRLPEPTWANRFRKHEQRQRDADRRDGNAATMEQRKPERKRFSPRDIEEIKKIDPTPFLERYGVTVRREGRHLAVFDGRDELYRITEKDSGWVWTHHHGGGGGDNISLLRELDPALSFPDAVYALRGGAPLDTQAVERRRQEYESRRPKLPAYKLRDRDLGRNYLEQRFIASETILEAERAGFLRYCKGGVLFCGRDGAGSVRSVTRRATNPADEIQKRDLAGSNKSFAPVLPGNPASVWLVEGGADALALQSWARSSGKTPPAVVVTGGKNVRSFLNEPRIADMLRRAESVTIAKDKERTPEKQAATDEAMAKLAEAVEASSGKRVKWWEPVEGAKDMAEHWGNLAWQQEQKRMAQERQAEAERQRQAEAARPRRSYGMER